MSRAAQVAAGKTLLAECRDDPVRFCREVLGFDPHEGQERWLQGSMAAENALVTGNRWGKSFVAAAKRIHRCFYRHGWDLRRIAQMEAAHMPYRSINVAISAQQSRLVWDNAERMLRNPRASWMVKSVKQAPFPRIEFANGAIFEARTTGGDGKYLLGENYDDVNWDEAAYEPQFLKVRDNVIRMRLVDRAGKLDYTSTGNGRNDFGRYFLTGFPGPHKDPLLYSQTGPTSDNPYVDHERIAQNAARMSDRMRRQNIMGEIVDGGGAFFSGADLDAATDTSLEFTLCEFDDEERESHAIVSQDGNAWLELFAGHRYVHGWDLADKADFTVGTTWDISTTPKTMVEFERFNRTGWSHVYDRIRLRHRKYGHGETWVDATGIGDVILDELKDINAKGVKFTASSKAEMLGNVQSMLSKREIRWAPIRVLDEEFRFYERDDAKLMTDCVMSVAVASEGMRRGGGFVYAAVL